MTLQAASSNDWGALLAEAWPTVAAHLERFLLRCGVDASSREDIIQDVAVRALARQVPFNSADDLMGWARTVGRNLWTDEKRRLGRQNLAVAPLDHHDAETKLTAKRMDPAELVEMRSTIDTLLDALRSMSALDREAVMQKVEGRRTSGRAETNRWGQRRFRVRERLRDIVEGAAAAFGLGRRRLRAVEHRLAEPVGVLAGVAAVQVAAVLLLLAPLGGGHQASNPQPVPPAESRPAVESVVHERPIREVAAASDVDRRPASRPRVAPEPALVSGPPPLVGLEVPSPTGGRPLVEGEVREEEGDDPLACLTNVPVLGTACPVNGDGLALP